MRVTTRENRELFGNIFPNEPRASRRAELLSVAVLLTFIRVQTESAEVNLIQSV